MKLQRIWEQLDKIFNKLNEEDNIEYHTTEDEWVEETQWIRVNERRNKKRKMNTSLTQTQRL